MDLLSSLNLEIVLMIIILLFSIIIHEMAHGYMALFLGDDTAENAGRLTLNPIPHADFFGSILIPAILIFSSSPFLFGYAKPIPYNPQNLRDRKWGDAKVAAAGPISNLLLALIFIIISGLLLYFDYGSELTFKMLETGAFLNIFLAVLNLIPVPPLDGSKVFLNILKNFYINLFVIINNFFNKYQLLLFIILLFILINTKVITDITVKIFEFYQSFIFWI